MWGWHDCAGGIAMRVIVAEDGLMRRLLVQSLDQYGFEVIGQARTKQELLRLVDADPPDIVTLDIEMPLFEADTTTELHAGLDAAREIRTRHPSVAILALSHHAVVPWAEELISLGTSVGYQLKDRLQEMDTLVEAMRAVV